MERQEVRTCNVCGREFIPQTANTMYCSGGCRRLRHEQIKREIAQREAARLAMQNIQKAQISISDIVQIQQQYNREHPNAPLSYGKIVAEMQAGRIFFGDKPSV